MDAMVAKLSLNCKSFPPLPFSLDIIDKANDNYRVSLHFMLKFTVPEQILGTRLIL
jgi:hypothetical protein